MSKSVNTDFFLVLTDFDPAILVFLILTRFYMRINDKIETLCGYRLVRQNGKDAKENKKCRRNDGFSCRKTKGKKHIKQYFMVNSNMCPSFAL